MKHMPRRHNVLLWTLHIHIVCGLAWNTYPQDTTQQETPNTQTAEPEANKDNASASDGDQAEKNQTQQEDATETPEAKKVSDDTANQNTETPETKQPDKEPVEQIEDATEKQADIKKPTNQTKGNEQQETPEETPPTEDQPIKEVVGQEYRGDVIPSDIQESQEDLDELPYEQEIVKLERPDKPRKRREKQMDLDFQETQLSDIVQEFANKKGINVILPHGEEAINQTVTFKHEKSMPISYVERYIHLFLDLAGYRMHPHGSYYIVAPKREKDQMRNHAPLYVNVSPHELPHTQQEIQAIYSLANLRVPESSQSNDPINQLLKSTLSNKKGYLFDPQSNSVIITDSAWNIASAMKTLLALDGSDSPEILTPVQLYNSSATSVAKMLSEQIIAQAQKGAKSPQKMSTAQYFTPNTHVVADARRNRLLLLGKEEAVNRVKDFVQEYIDAPTDTGQSILHVYELQYLDAKEFAPVLEKLVQPVGTQGQQAKKQEGTGPTRYFDGVKIIAEPEQEVQAETAEGGKQGGKITLGGNRLLIAATSDDWERLKRIIADLDKPQKQVIIEVLIADVSMENRKALSAQTRNPKAIDLPNNVSIQASHLSPNGPILTDNQKSIVSDLLRLLDGGQSIVPTIQTEAQSGSMLLSISDPYDNNKIWSLMQVLDKYIERKVLSHPYLVTRDNVQAKAMTKNIRRATGAIADRVTDPPTVKIEDFEARLQVEVTPRVSSQDRLNLQINVDIEDFISDALNRNTRHVETNTNMQTGQVLVLGGLSRTIENTTQRKTPLLGDLPLIGNLFKSSSKTFEQTNLAIFLTPTIVEPKLRQGLHRYTDDKVTQSYREAENASNAFDSLQQPITHFFFGYMGDDATPLDNYLDEVQYKQQQMKLSGDYYYDTQYEIMKQPQDNRQKADVAALKDKLQDEENPLDTCGCD